MFDHWYSDTLTGFVIFIIAIEERNHFLHSSLKGV